MNTVSHQPGTLAWREDPHEANRFTLGLNGRWLLSAQHNGEPLVDTQRANMRRLAACWNACEGLPTDVLEREPYIGMASYTMRMQAERERDAALATLAAANTLLTAQRAWIHAVPPDTQLPAMPGFDGDWADAVMAAVARATTTTTATT